MGAMASTAASFSRLGQEVEGAKGDKLRRQLQKHLNESARLQNMLGQMSYANQNEINHLNQDLQNLEDYGRFHSDQFTGKDNRRFLRNAIEEKTEKIRDLDKQKKTIKAQIKEKEDELKEKREYAKKHTFSEKSQSEFIAEYQKIEAEKLKLEKDLADTRDGQRDLRKKRHEEQKKLEHELIIKPMKDQTDQVILEELKNSDFDREKGDLTQTGLAQKAMRVNFARYNEARMQERKIIQNLSSASASFATQVDHFSGSKTLGMVNELGIQTYKIYDQIKHFKYALPQLRKFIEALPEEDFKIVQCLLAILPQEEKVQNDAEKEKSVKGMLDVLKPMELINGYIIPAFNIATAVLSALRLVHLLLSSGKKEEVVEDPKTKYIVKAFQNTFQEQQKSLHQAFSALAKYIETNSSHLQADLNELRSDLVHATEIVKRQIKGSSEEILDGISYSSLWKVYQKDINDRKISIRKMWDVFEGNKGFGEEDETLKYIAKLRGELRAITDPGLNGLMITTDHGEIKFELKRLWSDPEYFAGLFLSKIENFEHAPKAIPNVLLFREIEGAYQTLEKLKIPQTNTILESLQALGTEVSTQKNNIEALFELKKNFIAQALDAKKALEESVNDTFCIQKQAWRRFAEEEVARVRTINLGNEGIQKFESQFVGGEKYFISELIHNYRPQSDIK